MAPARLVRWNATEAHPYRVSLAGTILVQSSVFRLLLLIVLALGVLLLLRPGTISQLKSLAENFSGRPPASSPTTPTDPQPSFPSPLSATAPPISATAPAATPAGPSQANSGDAGETNVCDDARAATPYNRLLPLEITVPTPPVEPDLPAAGNVTVESLPPNNPLRGIPPPPAEEEHGFAPVPQDAGLPKGPQGAGFAPLPQGAGLPREPQDAGFAPGTPNVGLPPPNAPDLPPPPDDRPPDNRAADGCRLDPVRPRVASGAVLEPPSASRPQGSPPYVTPLLEPIRVAGLDPRGPSLSPGPPPDGQSPGATGPASALGGPPAAGTATGLPPTTTSLGLASEKQLCEGAQKVAQVGSQVILASDLNVAFNTWVDNQKKSKKPLPPEQIQQHRTEIEVSLLKEMTDEIMVYQDILRQVPEEALKSVRDKVSEVFETEELPRRIKNAGVGSRGELEEKLEKMGTSLEREKRTFIQSMLAQQWLQQQVKKDDDTFTPEEIFDYYHQHTVEFEHSARVKWEELMVRKSRHPHPDEAVALLGRLGNQVLDGAKLNEVARAGSEGSTARDGGLRDWTSKGTLVSETLENAIFSLPVGQLSRIIETDLGYHIVRVVERQDQSVTPFAEAQVEIRNKLVRQRKKKQMDDYLAKLHERTQIWTKYDGLMAQQQKASSSFFER